LFLYDVTVQLCVADIKVTFPALQLSTVSGIPPLLSTHIRLNIIIRRTSGRILGTFKQSNALSDIEQHWTERYFPDLSFSAFLKHI
jgi:hypothetical protein